MTNCTFVGNSFRWGGGVLNFGGDLTVANSLFVGNSGGAVIEDVIAKAAVTITDSTFVNNSGGAIDYFDPWVESTVSNCTFTSNRDGAIYTNGTLTVQTSVFTDNDFTAPWASTVTDLGGAIRNVGALTVTDSTFTGNTGHNSGRTANGGAICNYGTLLVANSTFVDSSVMTDLHPAFGGAIFNGSGGTLAVTNSTFSGNTAIGYGNDGSDSGGAIANQGYLSVVNSTFVGGHATNGGAIFNVATGTADLANTIISWSQSGGNCSGTMRDGGHNMSDDGSCGFSGTSRNQTNPMLDPAGLANNGGPTQTIGLLYFSPAINAGDETICAAVPVNNLDQRGYPRPGTGAANCSIGAFEFNASPPPITPTPSFANTPTRTPTPTPELCVGDCATHQQVTVDSILAIVNIALGNADVQTCKAGDANHDDQITVDEILTAVGNALNGCPK